jgi:predicted metal-dependent phosphoesterase TrpH
MLRADLHIHSEYSNDCVSKLEAIIRRCQVTGINCVAIADHGTANGALKMQKIAPFTVIVAEEIMTRQGEVIGMFLKETIPNNIPLAQAITRIHEQDGLVCIPHPFDRPNRSGLGGKVLENIANDIDIIEVFNSRSPLPWFSVTSRKFADGHGMAKSAGSDAHTLTEIGSTYIEMSEFTSKDDFLKTLKQGRIQGRMLNYLLFPGSLVARLRKII